MGKNKSTNIARDFGSYSRRVKGCILYVFGLWRNTEYGPKDKQDCGFVFSMTLVPGRKCQFGEFRQHVRSL